MSALWRIGHSRDEIPQEDPDNLAHDRRKDTNGGQYALTEAELERVRLTLRDNLFQAVCKLPALLDFDISEQSLRNNIKKRLNLKNRKTARKSIITANDQQIRLAYANEHG
ncbi:hypothetical protein TSAR_010225 [Trichomalopsis sarcophagae]|uniref:Transposase Tc1-like domain-containing protein n=1 Tax=Trichomalopsis sarcophagae TaxID=543379 RepID=A0A232FNJ6_9HYME|nr:hypothetical protein TSAR_010225 [Trichomalopsis sarcophagae]